MKRLDVPETEGYEILLIDSFSESDYAAFERAYRELSGFAPVSMSVSPEYFKLKTENFPDTLGPFILLLKKDGQAMGLAIGRMCRQVVEMRIGQRYISRPRRDTLIIPEDGFMVRSGTPESTRILMNALRASLGLKRFSVAHLFWLPRASETFRVALESRPRALRAAFPLTSEHWFTDLEKTFDEMIAKRSKKHRGNLRRVLKSIDEDTGRFLLRRFHDPADVALFIEDGESVVSGTYQRAWDVGFKRNKATEEIVRRAASTGDLFGYVLYADGKPCAFQLGISFGDVHTIMYMAHDPVYDDWSPGIYLLLKSFEELCASGSVHVVDYGWGDGEHKRRFGDRRRMESNVAFFAPSIDGLMLCAALSFLRLVTVCLGSMAAAFGVLGYLRKKRKEKDGKPFCP
jgi:hypothetical protein